MQQLLNQFGQQGIPCFFIIDFAKAHSYVYPLSHMPQDVLWSMESMPNAHQAEKAKYLNLKKKRLILTSIKQHLNKS